MYHHGDDHARLEDGVDVLPELQVGLPAVVVREDTEAVAVAE